MRLLIKPLLFGVLVVFPTMIVQRGLVLGTPDHDVWFSFGISAGVEEFVKWFVVYYVIFKHQPFERPYDGVLYAAAVSIGFASLENFIYLWSYQTSLAAMIFRGMLPVTAHALFAITMGYYFGMAQLTDKPGPYRKWIALSVLVPIAWHGTFDYLIIWSGNDWLWVLLPFMAVLWLRSLRKISRSGQSNLPVGIESRPPSA